jgi:CoA:oxalate CoA-transferase
LPIAAAPSQTRPASGAARKGLPLRGVLVLDLTQIFNGPYATYLLAAAGAEVIKIEPPDGEHLRKRTVNKASWLPYAMLNAGKQSLRLNLKAPEGREILLRLAEGADVLVENFAAGVMDRLGLGRDVLRARNPRLIYAASSGYGSDGPYRDYPAMDLTMQAMCGIINATGFPDAPPVKAGPAICDFMSGVHLYAGIVTALAGRERNGEASSVEVSMMEASYFALSSNLGMVYTGLPDAPARTGNRHGALIVCPYNVYPTSDGHIAIIVNHDQHWRSLTAAFDFPELGEDRRYLNNAMRVRHMAEVDEMVGNWTRPLTRAQIFERLIARQVPCAPVRDLHQVMNDPHLHARGSLRWVDHPDYGRIAAAASPLRFDGEASLPERPSVALGTDSRDILGQRLGLTNDAIDALGKSGVI